MPVLGRPDRLDIILEYRLVRGLLERLPGQPGAVPERPVFTACFKGAPVAQQEGEKLLTRTREL